MIYLRDFYRPNPAVTGLAGVFGEVVYGLAYALAVIVGMRVLPERQALMEAACGYLVRLRARFRVLVPKLLSGEVVRARAARASVGDGEEDASGERVVRRRRLVLPRGRGWLLRLAEGNGGSTATQLAALFLEPEHAALIAGSPRAQRLLRPLFRGLAIELPCVPALPRRARARRVVERRPSAAERRAALWYPNVEGKPIDLYGASRAMEAAAKKA